MLLLAFLACPGPGSAIQVDIRLQDVSLDVGTSPESIGPDATLRFDAALVQRTQQFGETETQVLSEGPFRPVILDENGEVVELETAPDPTFSEAYNSQPPAIQGWSALGGFAPGQYTVITAHDVDETPYALSPQVGFDVQPTAQDPELLVVGDTFLVQDFHLQGIEGVLHDQGSSWIRVAEREKDRTRLELIIESDYRCVAVNTWTDWSGDGFAWSQDSLHIEQDGVQLSGYGIFTNLPLSQDASEILSGQAHMVVDMSAVDQLMQANNPDWDDGESCSLIQGLGIDCGDCLVGEPGHECLNVNLLDLHATRLSEQEADALGENIPSCGVDLADIQAPVLDLSFLEELNFDCGCTTAAGFSSMSLGWLAMALVRTRRRKKKGADAREEESSPAAG